MEEFLHGQKNHIFLLELSLLCFWHRCFECNWTSKIPRQYTFVLYFKLLFNCI